MKLGYKISKELEQVIKESIKINCEEEGCSVRSSNFALKKVLQQLETIEQTILVWDYVGTIPFEHFDQEKDKEILEEADRFYAYLSNRIERSKNPTNSCPKGDL